MQSLFNKNGSAFNNSQARNKEDGPDLRGLAATSSRRKLEQTSHRNRRESSADQQHYQPYLDLANQTSGADMPSNLRK